MSRSFANVLKVGAVAALGSILMLSAYAANQGDAAHAIHQRQENFETIGASFKTVRDQLRGSRDMDAVYQAALTINSYAKNIESWFPAGTGPEAGVETEAKAEIWQKREEFSKAARNLVEKSGQFLELASTRDPAKVGGGVATLGGACKNCHDNFREEQD